MILVIVEGRTFKVEHELEIGGEQFYVGVECPNIQDKITRKETHLIRKSSLTRLECYIMTPPPNASLSSCLFLIETMANHVKIGEARPVDERDGR